jgi:hypothetical protein
MPDLRRSVVYRAVLGAIENTLDGHPSWKMAPEMKLSIAKRAAGTLMGRVDPSALAATKRSYRKRRRCKAAARKNGPP